MIHLKRTIAIFLAVICVMSILPISALGGVKDAKGSRTTSIEVPTLVTGSENISGYDLYYTNADYITSSYSGVILPVTLKKAGIFCVDYEVTQLDEYCYVELYKDANLSSFIDGGYIYDSPSGTLEFSIDTAGTYYIVFYSSSVYSFYNEISFWPYVISNQNRTLTAGKWAIASYNPNGTYYKFTVSNSRKLVTVYSNSKDVTIFLTDSKKNPKQEYVTYLDSDNNYRASYSLATGTYYICASGPYNDCYKIKQSQVAYPTLTLGKYRTFSQADGDMNMYFKFKATESGYASIKTKNFSGYITLCNSSFKAVSNKTYVNSGDKLVFGVKKGVTYYLRINDFSGNTSSIAVTNKKINDRSGSKKSSARSIYVGNKYYGSLPAATNQYDWYKFKLGSSKHWAIDFTGFVHGGAKVYLYKSNGTLISTHTYYDGNAMLYSTTKYPKGTYYLRISRNTTKASGYYSIKIRTSNNYLG